MKLPLPGDGARNTTKYVVFEVYSIPRLLSYFNANPFDFVRIWDKQQNRGLVTALLFISSLT